MSTSNRCDCDIGPEISYFTPGNIVELFHRELYANKTFYIKPKGGNICSTKDINDCEKYRMKCPDVDLEKVYTKYVLREWNEARRQVAIAFKLTEEKLFSTTQELLDAAQQFENAGSEIFDEAGNFIDEAGQKIGGFFNQAGGAISGLFRSGRSARMDRKEISKNFETRSSLLLPQKVINLQAQLDDTYNKISPIQSKLNQAQSNYQNAVNEVNYWTNKYNEAKNQGTENIFGSTVYDDKAGMEAANIAIKKETAQLKQWEAAVSTYESELSNLQTQADNLSTRINDVQNQITQLMPFFINPVENNSPELYITNVFGENFDAVNRPNTAIPRKNFPLTYVSAQQKNDDTNPTVTFHGRTYKKYGYKSTIYSICKAEADLVKGACETFKKVAEPICNVINDISTFTIEMGISINAKFNVNAFTGSTGIGGSTNLTELDLSAFIQAIFSIESLIVDISVEGKKLSPITLYNGNSPLDITLQGELDKVLTPDDFQKTAMQVLKKNLEGDMSGCVNIQNFKFKTDLPDLSLSFSNFTLSLCLPVPTKEKPNPTWVANVSCTCTGNFSIGRFKNFNFTNTLAIGVPIPAE